MEMTLHGQTKVRDAHRGLRLPVKSFFQMTDTREVEFIGRDTRFSFIPMNAIIDELIVTGGGVIYVAVSFYDGSDVFQSSQLLSLSMTDIRTSGLAATVSAAVTAYATANSFSIASVFGEIPTLPVTPSSYQTIVSQTGTSAPVVSGSLAPLSSYPAGTTFTWARTGAGVYTLTASTAVFNTSGKTGVFVGALNNLNGAWKAVVTSSTVITITTAVQSLAVLGLLGFTAAPTDALLTQTMVYVQTYP